MLRLVLLISGFTLAVTAASFNCVDKEVHSNSSTEVKKFTTRKGQLLFFPSQGFDGVTIKLFVHTETTSNISPEEMCVSSSRWYQLKVTVTHGSGWYQYCRFQVDTCSGKCGTIRDWSYDNFKSFSVVARGASFWSVNNTLQQTQCARPDVSTRIPSAAPYIPTTPAIDSQWSGEALMTWPVATGGGVVIVAAVVVVVCIVRKAAHLRMGRQQRQDDGLSSGSPPPRVKEAAYIRTNSLYEPLCAGTDTGMGRQQRQDDGLSSGSPPPGVEEAAYIRTNSLYEPFCAATDTGMGRQQGQDDGLSSGSPSPGVEEAAYIRTNSLYEPFCAGTDTGLGERQRQDDMLPSDSPPSGGEEAVYMNTNSLYEEPLCSVTNTGGVSFLATRWQQHSHPPAVPQQRSSH